MRPVSRFASAVVLASTLPALAWGPEGHRLVALVAQDHLTPAAREQVQVLLGKQSMADVSSFADDYRVDHRETAPWHYVDIPLAENTYDRERDCPASSQPPWRDCAPDRILYLVAQLEDPNLPRRQATFDLKMLIHFVGDLHQPLHTTGDLRGGNALQIVQFGTTQCTPRMTCNFHFLWDEGLIEHKRVKEYRYLAELESNIVTRKLADLPAGTPADWTNAGHRLAQQAWVQQGAFIGQPYYDREIGVVDGQLELAGLRLADLLNQIFPATPRNSGQKLDKLPAPQTP